MASAGLLAPASTIDALIWGCCIAAKEGKLRDNRIVRTRPTLRSRPMTQITPRVTSIYRYPVKGLSPEPMQKVGLEPGRTLPFDRAYAIENGPGRFDPEHPVHLPKITFLMLMRDE